MSLLMFQRISWIKISWVLLILLFNTSAKVKGQTPIDLSRPVNMTEGVAGSNGTGGSLYTISVELPDGVKGVQPEVSLSYSSQGGGNGFSGYGWTLGSLSMITRSGKDVFHDGIATPIDFTGDNDVFSLDGQRLMLISGNNSVAGAVYGTEQETFTKIEAIGGNGNSPEYFKVTTKNGLTLEYGTDNSKMMTNDGTQVIFWALRRVKDASGNYMLYNYSFDNANRYFNLSSITYTGNATTSTAPTYQVLFTYATKTDWQSSPAYISGSTVYSAQLLDKIDVKKSDGTQIRRYNCAYQYRQKKYFLTSVTESGANGTAINPVTFSYGKNPSVPDLTLTANYSNSTFTNINNVGDFDGDGQQDIMTFGYSAYTRNDNETFFKQYALRSYNAGSVEQQYYYHIDTDIPNSDVKVIGKEPAQNPYAVMDFDGDGKDDVLLAKFNKNSYNLTGININYSRVRYSGYREVTYKKMEYNTLPSSTSGQHSLWKQGGSFFTSGDFDGDGHTDYILILGVNASSFKAFLSTPSKNIFNMEVANFGTGVNGASGAFSANVIAESKNIVPINFNGDSKTELLVVRDEASYILSVYPVSNMPGYNFASSVLYTTADIKTNYKIYPGDFNGDGNTDLLVRPPGRYDQWKIFTSTGNAFNSVNFNFSQLVTLHNDGTTYSNFLSVGDYDGDGKTDIWHSGDINSSTCRHWIYYSNGTSFAIENFDTSPTLNTEFAAPSGDFNGDGKLDFLKVNTESSSTFYGKYLFLRPLKEQNLLVGISNLGHLTNFDYGLLNNKDNSGVYKRTQGDYSASDLSSPSPYFPEYSVSATPMYLLSNIKRPNGIAFQSNEYYAYEDMIVHSSGRGFLGFLKIESRNDMGALSWKWDTINLNYSTLIPWVTQKHLNAGGLFTRTRYQIGFNVVSSSSTSNRRFFMKQDRTFTHDWLTTEGTEVLNTYDNYGNVIQSIVNKGATDDFNITSLLEKDTVTTVYGTFAGGPFPGFPTSVTKTKIRTGKPLVSKITNYTYTAQGLPQTVTEHAGTAIETVVTNTYNNFGLPTQTSTSAPGVTTPVISYVYDPTGRYVLEKNRTGGGVIKKETATFDDRWGVPLTNTTPDGLTTTYQYNEFGELIRTNYPDGTAATITKSWETTTPYARYSTLTQRLDGSSPVKSYFDILDREIKKEKRGFNNNWLTSTKSYNYLGQLDSETLPFYSNEPIHYIYYFYDAYGRLDYSNSKTGNIIMAYSTTGGSTLTVQTTNSLGQWTSKTSDASGKIISASDNGVNTSFTYDSWGNQLTVSSSGQTFVTYGYDSYGRKISVSDINAGSISYEYNSIGQLTKQTDANNNVETIAYDVFGRLLSKTGVQGTTTYEYFYDAVTGKSSDKITQEVGFGGDVHSYRYDGFQRLSSESMTAAGNTMTKLYDYDTRGNLKSIIYPAGFSIRNVYDDNDIVTQVNYLEGSSTRNLFTATQMNSRGTYTGYNTGNGKSSSVTWDYDRELPKRYYTSGIQDLNLDYEAFTMNLWRRRDGIRNITENFTYDVHDRLTSAQVNGVQQFGILYDGNAQGKILQKTDIGNYNYNTAKPQAIASLSSGSSGANPSVLFGTQLHSITYTSFLKPATITESGYQLSYSYGSDEQRITSTLKLNGSTVETKSYWGEIEGLTKGSNTYEIYYIQAGNGLNNIIVKKDGVISIYYVYTDQLGSIVAVTNESGSVVAEQNFDAWGRKRNPVNWGYSSVPAVPDWLYRGFTGHEHITAFNLINMNARLYDPMTGMMISPDNFNQNPFSPAGYNGYLYANGNPLKYIDKDGNFAFVVVLIPIVKAIVIGAAIGAATYTVGVAFSNGGFQNWNWGQFGKAAGFGAISGLVTYGIGSVFGTVGSMGIMGELGRAAAHGLAQGGISELSGGNFMTGLATGAFSSLAGSAFMMYGGKFANSDIGMYAFSAAAGGATAELTGGNFWEGAASGLIIAGLNHGLNSFSDKLAEAAEKYKNDPSLYKKRWDVNSAPKGAQKCNYFLNDLSEEIGIPLDRSYSAGEWADPNVDIPGWSKAFDGKPSRGTSAGFKYSYESGATGHVGVITDPKTRYLIYNGLHEIRGTSINNYSGWKSLNWRYRIPVGKK
ncbi:FG-GAP-like repeat-containing protein [Niabella sp.]|uniref:FG-GAP-like repeat-containing protein n=1 Tax=Niabella sp. TaxID=1962976 RepID=UPI0026297C02|nr:FG-GAP-like repeat-containing protein [Niabella sp.]